MNAEPVTFENLGGSRLFGMLHPVEAERRRPEAIVLLSPGIKNRVAPHRLYVKMADRYQSLGYEVFRFDPEGLGDSEGEFHERYAADLYRAIQTGRFAADTRSALDWMEKERGFSRFVVGGLCGGAITGLHAGTDDRRVVGLLSLGIPVILDGSEVDKIANLTQGQLDGLRRSYVRNLLDPSSWLRLLTFRTDFRLLVRSVLRRSPRSRGGSGSVPAEGSSPDAPADNFNPMFPAAFERFAAGGRKMLLLFSEADRLYWEWEEKFVARHPELVRRWEERFKVHVCPEANHIFSFRESQEEMLKVSSEWLEREISRV